MSLKYLRLKMDGEDLDIDTDAELPILFDYKLEDAQDFQKKKSSESLGLKIPATLNNQRILNTFQNTSVDDNTDGQIHKGIRNIVAEANGQEIFVGKAMPKKTIKRGSVPKSFELNCFGNNANWMIDLKEVTLFELMKHISFIFDKPTIESSWLFDGTDEGLPYVFAPVKYSGWMDIENLNDKNYSVASMKPSLSKYWILYWAFKSVGYQIKSNFLDSEYYRRQVMPWTYGSFLSSEGTKYQIHLFLAKSVEHIVEEDELPGNHVGYFFTDNTNRFVDLDVRDDAPGCFDNNNTIPAGDYTGDGDHGGGDLMKWKYNTPHYGPLEVTFSLNLSYEYNLNNSSDFAVRAIWFKKDGITGVETELFTDHIRDNEAPVVGNRHEQATTTRYFTVTVNPNDEIWCGIWLWLDESKLGSCWAILNVGQFQIDYFRIPVGGTIAFDSYLTLQKHKFLDFLRGEIDLGNLSIQTDPVNKVVLIEPTHDYSTDNDLGDKKPGYFTKNTLDFAGIEDISQDSIVELYDDNAREYVFKFKNDSNDGALKIVQDRYKITLASGKYLFSERFKAEKTDFENRYFSPVMHYLVDDFAEVTGITPQMICLVPENISNTSSPEAQNTFSPKTAYYKGLVTGVGGWIFDGELKENIPYMFAVNYKEGGENDPILSYSDEKIGVNGNYVIGKGLIKRFFWQRLAIMDNGQWLHTNFKLNNNHITNWFHRERIDLNGELWELIEIDGYNCLTDKSTKSVLRKWVPISQNQIGRIYPSESSVLTNAVEVIDAPETPSGSEIDKVFDTQYNPLLCLYNDIPREQL